ncbi:MAG: gamma-glutamyltransferase family protein [Alphaproteobacteria bacterium]|nr:gamma-glutamyltransferase family protein [Alphaproteobacteria bacterium]
MTSSTSPYRARVMGTRHMAAAGHYLAAQSALQVLEAGGNAVDAGCAGGMALTVLQSEYVGFAGVAPMMIYLAERDEVVTIAGLGPWPKAASLDYFHREHDGAIPPGIMRTVVPAGPDAWITALERFGTMSFGEVAQFAIRFARDGFPAPRLMCDILAGYEDQFRRWPSSEAIYMPGGRLPRPGELFVQADLGRTIQYMADQESAARSAGREAGLAAARDAFYRGDIGLTIARYHAENGGWMTLEDLDAYRSPVLPPLTTEFGDTQVFACGPWCQGPMLAQTLNLLEGIDLGALGHNTADYIHTVTECLKLAFADRHAYYGDPNFIDVPLDRLLDKAYAAERRGLVKANEACPEMPPAGEIEIAGLPRAAGAAPAPRPAGREELDTSYICVVDKDGNAFSGTPSDGSGAAPVIPGLGIVPSTRGSQNNTDPNHPACLAPGKRPRLTPNPAMAIRDGRWMMPFGSPGNDVQIQAMTQVLMNMLVFGMTPQDAVEAPRFASYSYPRSSAPFSYSPGELRVESRIDASVADDLAARGHVMKPWSDWEYPAGAVCTIVADRETGVMEGGSDPRRPTGVAGW